MPLWTSLYFPFKPKLTLLCRQKIGETTATGHHILNTFVLKPVSYEYGLNISISLGSIEKMTFKTRKYQMFFEDFKGIESRIEMN